MFFFCIDVRHVVKWNQNYLKKNYIKRYFMIYI